MPSSPSGLPPWLKTRLGSGPDFTRLRDASRSRGLNTVCDGARCPNIGECWSRGTATFMVLGSRCTRGCRFCGVPAGRPEAVDPAEPRRLADTLAEMRLKYAVITMVCRDDLPDQGARHMADCLRAVRSSCPGMTVEALIGDFGGDRASLKTVLEAGPHVLSHNIETVESVSLLARDRRCGYRRSLDLLRAVQALAPSGNAPSIPTKSSLMLGLGESAAEVRQAMTDLREAGVSLLTIGQYLRPTKSARHLPVREFVPPERFDGLKAEALGMGFLHVASGPFVRSSYRVDEGGAVLIKTRTQQD
ncbi:MAG: lipoyl synthase [Elusimicrobia bacterium]|nr:lipoyl synthase [Elusimicrobiota bacterium]